MVIKTHLSHSEIEDKLVRKLERMMKKRGLGYNGEKRDGYSDESYVETETTHKDDNLPSGKQRCRVDVEWKTTDRVYAFEVKRGKQDLKKWFTQRRDYNHLGMQPVLVLSEELCYQIIPHQEKTLKPGYVAFDERKNAWHWGCSTNPPNVEEEFKIGDTLEYISECPKCGCWVDSSGVVVDCKNCNWSAAIKSLQNNEARIEGSPYYAE